jgi:hypothetical protein
MKYTFFIVISIYLTACKKELLIGHSQTGQQQANKIIGDDVYLQPPSKLMMYPEEAPLPERPYMLVEYINVQRAYTNIPQTNSYSYSFVKTIQYPEAGETYTPPSTMIVDFDTYQPKPAMDIARWLDCFQTISDFGASCSIELFTDLPVDAKPEIFFNWDNQSPGHTFIQLKKSNLGRSMVLNVGLYPNQAWKTIYNTGSIAGKFINDSQHEFNASFKMVLTPEQFSKVISKMRLESKLNKYDIDDYNCTDFAVSIFNSVRSVDPIIIPKYQIPGSLNTKGSSTPQGLYREIFRRFKYSSSSRPFITLPQNKSYVETSKIPCIY